MTLVTRIYAAVQVQDDRWSGSKGPLFLTLTGADVDLFTSTWAYTLPLHGGDLVYDGLAAVTLLPIEQRKDPLDTYYYDIFTDIDPYVVAVETNDIGPQGARLGVRGNNLIRPRHVAVWGEAALPRGRGRLDAHEPPPIMTTPIPIAVATGVEGVTLSGDNREGPQTMPVPVVAPTRGRDTPVTRLLVMVGLGNDPNAATSSSVSVRVRRDDGLVVDATLEGFSRLQSGQWKVWLISDDVTSFTRQDLDTRDLHHNDTVTLHVLGEDKAQIRAVVVFGLADPVAGTPRAVHQLVYAGMHGPLDAWIGGTTAADQKLRLELANYVN
jgi:hypothetical protein